jgi:hypothetical protein
MAVQRPLVINTTTGEIERLALTDYIDERDIIQVTNNTGGPLVVGTPVYQTATANEAAKAQANALATARVLGLVLDISIADAASGSVLTDGRLTATTGQWDAVTGQVGGLTTGARYYVSAATPGTLTTTPPTADGHVIAPVGTAKSTTELEITIGTRIVL